MVLLEIVGASAPSSYGNSESLNGPVLVSMFMRTLQLGGFKNRDRGFNAAGVGLFQACLRQTRLVVSVENAGREIKMSEANIATVQSLYAAFGRGDIDAIVNGCLPDVTWASGGRKEDYPPFGMRKGTGAVRDFFRSVAEVQDFDEFSPREFYAD